MTSRWLAKGVALATCAVTDGPSALRIARTATRRYGAVQRTWELAKLVGVVRRLRPRTVLEIGSHEGGTLYCWGRAAADDACLVSLDLVHQAGDDRAAGQAPPFSRFVRSGQRLVCVGRDSHAPDARADVERAIGDRPIDFLFIDGDHSYEGVCADYAMFAPLVRRGGMVALHDINRGPLRSDFGVPQFWRELEPRARTLEFIDVDGRREGGMGIGVVVRA